MSNTPIPSIEAHFATLSDPRVNRTKKHKLLDIIIIAICAVICGADGWVAVEAFGALQRWTRLWGLIPNLDQPATNTKKVSTITDRKRVSSL